MSTQPLGVILAGGRSMRFGGDKALARIGDVAMLDRVADRLRPQCETIAVVGRDWPPLPRIDDLPGPGLGPLGGLAGALAWARDQGMSLVLTCGCDLPGLPTDLVDLLGGADAVVADQPTVGLWRTALADDAVAWLVAGRNRSMRAWAKAIGARSVAAPPMPNINRVEDLAAFNSKADRRSSR